MRRQDSTQDWRNGSGVQEKANAYDLRKNIIEIRN